MPDSNENGAETNIDAGRRQMLKGATAMGVAAAAMSAGPAQAQSQMRGRTFVLIHGAWHGGWCWSRVSALLAARGHRVFAPSLIHQDAFECCAA